MYSNITHAKQAFNQAYRYYEWDEVPKTLKTKKKWGYLGRTVSTKTIPEGILGDYGPLDYEDLDAVDPFLVTQTVKQYHYLYSLDQTREFKKPFDRAYHRFIGLFCQYARQDDYIAKPYEDLDAKGWFHRHWPLRDSIIKAHILHKQVIGVIGNHFTNDIIFDVDYHDADARRELFLARCQAIYRELSAFFPGCPWFAEHKIEDIGGCHFRVIVGKMHISKAQKLGQEFLSFLDKKYPNLAAIESFTKIEVYPVLKGDGDGTGLRLPLCRGRVTVTDRHLLEGQGQNCIDLIEWITDPARKNLSTEEFIAYLVKNTPEHSGSGKKTAVKSGRQATGKGGMGNVGSLKGCFYRKLIDFWSENIVLEPDTIGIWICVTLRALKFEGLTEAAALDWVEDRLLALKDTSFSDRLSDDFAELMRVTRLDASAIWKNNGYQPRIEESNEKLTKAVAFYNGRGIVLHDPSTWGNLSSMTSLPVDFSEFEDFRFTYEQRLLLKEWLHPVLHVEDIAVTYEVARRIVLFVHKYPTRELAGAFLPFLCAGLGVQWHRNKCHKALWAMRVAGFVEIVGHKKWRGRLKQFNQARRYDLGEEMAEVFCGSSPGRGAGVLVSIISTSNWSHDDSIQILQREKYRLERCSWVPVGTDTS